MKIELLSAPALDAVRPQLVDLLLDALAQGAAMGFPAGLTARDADQYWQGVQAGMLDGTRLLLAAAHEGTLVGIVQLELYRRPSGCDGAELQTMMVHSRVRRRGIGSVLLRAAEAETRALGRTLLFLDTAAGSAAEALADEASPTSIYYKSLLMPELA